MQSETIYLFVGNGSEESGATALVNSNALKVPFHGVLDEYTVLQAGAYHTSIYDINFLKLKKLVSKYDMNLICLGDKKYTNEYDFYFTQSFLAEESLIRKVKYIDDSVANIFLKVLFENKALCLKPWMAIHQDGNKIDSCCLQTSDNDYDLELVKKSMLAGKKPKECNHCYELEDGNSISSRIIESAEWGQRLDIKTVDDLEAIDGIKYFDFRLDNTCNLMCRTCGPGASNLIENEYIKIGLYTGSKRNKKTKFLDEEQLKSGKRFYFAGGEPLWHPDFLLTLKQLEQLGLLNADIQINTNAAKIPKKVIDIFQKFSSLHFTISFDGYKDKLTYIRWPNKWDLFCENVEVLNKLSNKPLLFNCVISLYNISHCYDMLKWIEDTYNDAQLNFTILTTPKFQQAKYFPNKQIVLEEIEKLKSLKRYLVDEVFVSKVKFFENLLRQQEFDKEILKEFFKFNDLLDRSRGCNLIDYIPELEECRKLI